MNDRKYRLIGHAMAFITILVWGSTFISTKVLLSDLTPIQIMLCRFAIAYVVLWLLHPKWDKTAIKDELRFAVMSIFGCTLYFIAENYALQFTLASNVSIIVAGAPILTAILAHFFTRGEKLNKNIFVGFAVAFFGVIMVVLNGKLVLQLNPIGDLLSLAAAVSWAVYSVMLKNCVDRFNGIMLTRKLMFYGFIITLPIAIAQGDGFSFEVFAQPVMFWNIMFLGVVGSGICYVLWNRAMSRLGVVATNSYMYLNPFITLVVAGIFLKEPITVIGFLGAVLIISGVVICSKKPKKLIKNTLSVE